MSIQLAPLPVPLREEPAGTFRIGKTRVTLDVLIDHYQHGYSCEQLVQAFDSLCLNDVYSVIAYYLNHREEIDAYLAGRAVEGAKLRTEIEQMMSKNPARERLLTRLKHNKP